MKQIVSWILFIVVLIQPGCKNEQEKSGIKAKISKRVDSLLNTDVRSGIYADSLKKAFFSTTSDTAAIDILNEIAYYWKGNQLRDFAREAGRLSKQIAYERGNIMSLARYGYSCYWNYKDDSAKYYYDKALEESKLKGYRDIQAGILADIGDLHRVHFEHDKALEYYRKALDIVGDTTKSAFVARIYSVIADVKRITGNNKEARKFYTKAIHIAKTVRDYQRLAFCYAYIADIYRLESAYTSSMKYLNMALPLALKARDENILCDIYCNKGELYRYLFEPRKSIASLKEGLHMALRLNDKSHICYAYANLGVGYRSLDQTDSALFCFHQQLKVADEINEVTSIINSCINLGELYLNKRHDMDSATVLFNQAFELSNKIGFINGFARINYFLGEISFKKKNYSEAIHYAEMSADYCRKGKLAKDLVDVSYLLSRSHEELGNLTASLSWFRLNINLRDSILDEEQIRKFSAAEFEGKENALKERQRVREKQHQLVQARKEKEIQQQRFIRNTFIVGFIVIGLFSILLVRSLRQNKRSKKIIEQQKEEVEEKQKEILDSIRYARRIQSALMTPGTYIDKNLKRLNSAKKSNMKDNKD